MKAETSDKSNLIEANPFINVVEFCPFEGASDLLACGSQDSLCIYSVTFQSKPGTNVTPNSSMVTSEKLITLEYYGTSCISWSPVSNMRYLPRCAKLAFGMDDSNIAILTTNFKDDSGVVTLHGHTKGINAVAFEPVSGSKLASTGDDHTCHIWNVETGQILHSLILSYAGVDINWNTLEPGKLLLSEQSGCLRMYDIEDAGQQKTVHPILSLEADCGTLTSSHWCPTNPLRVGAVVGNEWVLWDISHSVLPEETRQTHSGGCTKFRWSRHHEDIFLTQGRPKHTTNIHHLGHRELLFQEIGSVGSGASWHFNLPICAVASNSAIKIYNLNCLSQMQ